ncbi:hypothetical protein HOY82DRAFT_565844 [Tuber indicum]|nr:hypothetical protein HOY82DRAFT_565844 [Tuber indicum]
MGEKTAGVCHPVTVLFLWLSLLLSGPKYDGDGEAIAVSELYTPVGRRVCDGCSGRERWYSSRLVELTRLSAATSPRGGRDGDRLRWELQTRLCIDFSKV